MILLDNRVGSKELRAPILSLGVSCQLAGLKWADAAFDGYGPKGETQIGVERKTLHDILDCIDTSRYNAQRIGMSQMYGVSLLMIEGLWKSREDGVLMEGFRDYEAESRIGKGREVIAWTECKQKGARRVMFSTLYRYLSSVAHTGVIIKYPRDLNQTAACICEEFHYYQKKWELHKSMREVYMPTLPSLRTKQSATRKWAFALDGVGVVGSEQAEKHFVLPIRLANSEEQDWVRAGIDVKTAQSVIREIRGW